MLSKSIFNRIWTCAIARIILLIILLSNCALANFSIFLENDVLFDMDADYTHGTKISYSFGESTTLNSIFEMIPIFKECKEFQYSFVLGQNIFTPFEIENPELIKDDRPYAGYLYLGLSALEFYSGGNRLLEITLGTIGPNSYAKEVQTEFHRLINAPKPMGWDHQLNNELTFQLQYFDTKTVFSWGDSSKLMSDICVRTGYFLGNVQIAAILGVDIRLGYKIPPLSGSYLIFPSHYHKTSKDPFFAYLFVGSETRAYLWNVFFDGNSMSKSHSVRKERFVSDARAGFGIGKGRFDLLVCIIDRSKEHEFQNRTGRYSSLRVTYQF